MTYRKRGKNTLEQMLRSFYQLLSAQNTSDTLAHLADPELLSYLQVSAASSPCEIYIAGDGKKNIISP